jgi:hypothetical protein
MFLEWPMAPLHPVSGQYKLLQSWAQQVATNGQLRLLYHARQSGPDI